MGASNFARGNTSKVFAVLMNTEEKFSKCEECDEQIFEYQEGYIEEGESCECGCTEVEHDTEYRAVESWEVSEFYSYLKERAEEKVKGTKYKYREANGKSDNDRSYPATELFHYDIDKTYGDITVEVRIIAQIVGAYYEGASLDFTVGIYNDSEFVELENGRYTTTEEDVINDLFYIGYADGYHSSMSLGLRTMLSKHAIKWAEKEVVELKNRIEEVFTEVSEPLTVVGTFSNGETIYSK